MKINIIIFNIMYYLYILLIRVNSIKFKFSLVYKFILFIMITLNFFDLLILNDIILSISSIDHELISLVLYSVIIVIPGWIILSSKPAIEAGKKKRCSSNKWCISRSS
uniref:hypothetical protein n=1 Tax=Hericium alpestre TaxID=135208 RepID=UPI002434C067|nr:hypothetical protein QEO35_mgp19 [Hericium alpestre]WEX32014.1 hypothetical protein [Hericium alpestre]